MKLNLTRVSPFLPGAFLLLGLTSPAYSQNTLMVPNMSYCTQQLEAASILLGETYGDSLTFTIQISTTATGPTRTIWTHHGSYNPPGGSYQVFNPPTPGTYFWRMCATNPSKFSVGVAMGFGPFKGWVPQPITLQSGSIAVMPPNGIMCGAGAASTTNRLGLSTRVGTGTPVPVLWFDVDTDDNGDQLTGGSCNVNGFGEFDCVTTAKLNDTVQPVGDGNLTSCVINTSSTAVQVSLNQ